MVENLTITDSELRLARQGALSAARSGRGLVATSDLISESNLWMIEHYEKVVLWRDEGVHGKNKLRLASRQRCLTIIARERRKRSGLLPGDIFYYTPAIISEILPDIFEVENWTTNNAVNMGERRSPSRPAEGNNRVAMISDVRSAFYGLPKLDQRLLTWIFKESITYDTIAVMLDCAERTVRRREARVLEKMVERLGGEPPWSRT